MTTLQHAARVGLLMGLAAALLGWVLRHSETSFADGLRYIRQAEQIESGTWRDGLKNEIDHPLHPLGIAAMHRTLGGVGPRLVATRGLDALLHLARSLMVIPIYLLALELLARPPLRLACVLAIVNPIIGYVVVNVLSESTFLLWWSFGLWGSLRFLREGRLIWLAPAIGFGVLAYLTRPEGMLLPAALTATLLILPLLRATRINQPRWWRVTAVLVGGLLLLAGPYMTLKGGVATKPGIARVLGLAPRSQPLALEREKPLPPGQTTFETYQIATVRMLKVFRAAVTPQLFPFALLGVVLARRRAGAARACGLFLGIILAASAVALVRLHATGGYCTVRHGLVPGLILTLAAAYGLTWLMSKVSIPGAWLGLAQRAPAARPRRLGHRDRGPVRDPQPSRPGTAQSRTAFRVPRDRSVARAQHPELRSGARPDGLVALLQPAPRLCVCQRLSSTGRPRHPLDRGPQAARRGPLALQRIDPQADRRPRSGRADSRAGLAQPGADPRLRSPVAGSRDRGRSQPAQRRDATALTTSGPRRRSR